MEKSIVDWAVRDFDTDEGFEPKEYFVYFVAQIRTAGLKDPQTGDEDFWSRCPIKRERGEFTIHPAVAPVSLLRDYSVCDFTHGPALRRTEPCGP